MYYGGTSVEWKSINIRSNNEALLNARIHFAYSTTPGDIDGNEKLDTDDAVYLLLSIMFGTEDYPVAGGVKLDYTGNGIVDTDDAVYLLLHVMFGEVDYPI